MKFPNIEAERARSNMTKSQLSFALSICRSTYSNWQTGKSEIPISKIIEMCKLFGVSADYLLEITSKQPRKEQEQ